MTTWISPSGMLDGAAVMTSTATLIMVAADIDVVGRPVIALVFVMFCPGWALERAFGARVGTYALIGAFMLSLTIAILSSMLAVSVLGWNWQVMSVTTAAATVVLLAGAAVRRAAGACPSHEAITDRRVVPPTARYRRRRRVAPTQRASASRS